MSLYILVVCVCVYVRMCVYESSVITLPSPPPAGSMLSREAVITLTLCLLS